MTPDEHRAKAESLRAAAESIHAPIRPTPEVRDRLIAEAQLHATLALGKPAGPTDVRCSSYSPDNRRCHGDVGHPGTHWAGASRVWSDVDTDPGEAPRRTPEELAAQELFQWNTPTDPYFVITGRVGEVSDEDPYLPIVRVVFGSVAMVDLLTSGPALAAFREALETGETHQDGVTTDDLRRGMVAAIEAVS